MNQIYLFTHSGKEDRILDGHISASGHGCHTVAEECSVAGGAVGYAHSGQLLFARDRQLPVAGAGRDDDSPRRIAFLRAGYGQEAVRLLHTHHIIGHEFRAQFIRVLPELHAQVVSVDSRKPRIVIHLVGVEHLAAAGNLFFNDNGLQLRTLGVDRRRKSCRT